MRVALALAFLAVAGAARAEGPQVRFEAENPVPAIRLPPAWAQPSAFAAAVKAGEAEGAQALPPGVAHTAIDHRFSPSGGVVGSIGYLCGMQKSDLAGSRISAAYEPAGTFLGGQLKLAF